MHNTGQNLAAKYPQISVFHGAKYFISPLISDVANISSMKTLTNRTKHIYQVFIGVIPCIVCTVLL